MGGKLQAPIRRALAVALTAAVFAPLFFTWSAPDASKTVASTVLLPASFTENAGQLARDDVRYYAALGTVRAAFVDSGVLLQLSEPRERPAPDPTASPADPGRRQTLLEATFEGSARTAPAGLDLLPARSHFFLGNDASRWRRDVRSYGRVAYEGLYPGVDLVYTANAEGLKYEFRVAPGADPGQIAIRYRGASGLAIDPSGDLVLGTGLGALRDTAPRSYQGAREVSCAFVLRSADSVGFACDGWDPRQALVIDPLVYSTYLGGTSGVATGNEFGWAIAVDGSGNAYVAGETDGTFPTTNGSFDATYNGGSDDVFVAKLNASGTGLLWSAYLGGSAGDFGPDIALDSAGSAYLTGTTESTDFPTTPGAFQNFYGGGTLDAFVTKISADGSAILYSTYLGGGAVPVNPGLDAGRGIAVDAAGNAFVTGYTEAPDFPTTPGAFQNFYGGGLFDGFLVRISPSGLGPLDLLYGTYLGGGGFDRGHGVAVDASGNAYMAGDTDSTNFPTTLGAFDTFYSGGLFDGWTAKMNPVGGGVTDLVYSTYLGGGGFDAAYDVAVDGSGSAYVAGFAQALGFPTTVGAYDTTYNGGFADAFVAKLNAAGSALTYATFLGGSGTDFGLGLAIDSAGNAYLTGDTDSSDFPLTAGAVDTTLGGFDAYAAKLDPAGATLAYSTYLGGSLGDFGREIDVDGAGAMYLTGFTLSSDFPVVTGSFDTTHTSIDAFAAKIAAPAVGGVACLTLGYWKNHAAAWPVTSLTLGAVTYTQAQLLAVLGTAPRGDASLILAHQLIAAKLNVAAGSNPSAAASAIAAADSLLATYAGSLPYAVKASSAAGQSMTAAAGTVDAYNNGLLSPAC